jgi:hypothetical protein
VCGDVRLEAPAVEEEQEEQEQQEEEPVDEGPPPSARIRISRMTSIGLLRAGACEAGRRSLRAEGGRERLRSFDAGDEPGETWQAVKR